MRFVPVKSAEQQSWLAVHRLREELQEERTACINRIRGLLAEFGLVFPQRPELLRQALPLVLDDMNNELPDIGRLALQQALLHWIERDGHLAWCDERVAAHARFDARARAIMPLSGIGCGDCLGHQRQRRRPRAARQRAAVRVLARLDAFAELHRRQGRPGA